MRRLRQLGAILILAILLAGVPWLFAVTIGNPLHGWKDLSAGDLSSRVVIDVLAAIVWIAWAQFTVSVLVETSAALRRAPLPSHIPGVFDAQQHLARRLVAAALLVGTVAAAVAWMPHASAAPVASTPPGATSSLTPPVHRTSTAAAPIAEQAGRAVPATANTQPATLTTVYLVPAAGQGPDTLWDIAESRLGTGERWHDIWALNQGRTQADGTVMTDPGLLRPGWTVLIPHDTATHDAPPSSETVVHVVPGDTLTEIADEHDATEPAVWELNHGRVMSDGRRFTNPDLIKPGDTILIPAAAEPPVPNPDPPSTTPPPPRSGPQTAPTQPRPPTHPMPSNRPSPSDLPPSAPAPEPPASMSPTAPSSAPAPSGSKAATTNPAASSPAAAPAATHPAHTDRQAGRAIADYVAVLGGGAALLAGTLYTALRRYRRRQLRHRPAGHIPAPTSAGLRAVDAALHISGAPALSTVETIDRALRWLYRSLGDPTHDGSGATRTTPGLLLLTVDPSTVHLQFDDHPPLAPPSPWAALDDHRWQASRGDLNRLAPTANLIAPYPTLVSAVHDGDRETLLNLAEFGMLAVTGDAECAANWLRFVAGELAHNTWSDHLTVTLAGLEPDLIDLNPARLAHTDDVPAATRALRAAQDVPEILILGPGWHDDPESRAAILSLLPALTDPVGPRTGSVVLAYLPDDLPDDPADDMETPTAHLGADHPDAQPSRSSGALRVHIDAAGVLSAADAARGLDLTGPAAQLPATHAAGIAARLAEVRGTDPANFVPLAPLTPLAPATTPAPQQHDDDASTVGAAGVLPIEAVTNGPVGQTMSTSHDNAPIGATPAAGAPTVGVWDDRVALGTNTLLPASNLDYVTRSATTLADLQFLAPSIQLTVAAGLDHDTTLDADVAAWRNPNSPRAKLTLLGPVTLTAHGRVPVAASRSPPKSSPTWRCTTAA